MPATTVNIKPNGDNSFTWTGSQGYGTHTAAGTWGGTVEGAGSLFGYLDEVAATLDETNYHTVYSKITSTAINTGKSLFSFEDGPTAVTISSLALKCYARYSWAGGNFWTAEPQITGIVNIASTDYSGSTVTITNYANRNTQAPTGTFGVYTLGTWATNPNTSTAWQVADLVSGQIFGGFKNKDASHIPHSNGGSYAHTLDIAALWIELTATPVDAGTDIARGLMSRILRRESRPARTIQVTVPVELGDLDVLSPAWVNHKLVPTADGLGSGQSMKDWERLPVYVLSKEENVAAKTVTLVLEDGRESYCTFWSTWRTDIGATDDWNGVPRLDMGGGYQVDRNQVGWLRRPNDYAFRDANTNKWRISPYGLSVMGGEYTGYTPSTGDGVWYLLRNTFSAGSGADGASLATGDTTAFTSWTWSEAGAGNCIIKQDSSFLFDVASYRRAARIQSGNPWASNYGYFSQGQSGFPTTWRVRVGLLFKAVTGDPTNFSYALRRTTASTDWNQSTSAWAAPTVFNKTNAGLAVAGASLVRHGSSHLEYWSQDITVGGSGGQTLTLFPGYIQVNSGEVDLFGATILSTGASTGLGAPVIRRDWLAITSAATHQKADIIDLKNEDSGRIWYADRGFFSTVFIPRWDHEDLADGSYKYIASSKLSPTNDDYEVLYYYRTNSTTGKWVFARYYGGALSGTAAEFATSGATIPRYFQAVKLAARWIGASAELGLAVRTLDIFVNGVKGTAGTAAAYCRQAASGGYVALGRKVPASGAIGSSDAPHYYADGYLADMEIRYSCPNNTEVARLHNSTGKNLGLPVAVS